jgi:phosphoglycolate phosphatase-like HAD superfamily hydrolase
MGNDARPNAKQGSVEAVLFDVDGTLQDSVDLHAEAWRRTFAEFGYDLSFERVRSQIGKGGDQLMPSLLPKEEIQARGKQIEARRQALYKAEFMPRVRPFPCVRDLLARIVSDGKKIALASSAKGDELDYYVRLLNIGDLIDTGTTSDDAERSKPHPDVFVAALERLGGREPGRTFVVGDTPYDGEAALRAGCRFLAVRCGGFPEEDLQRAGAEAIYDSPEDLLRRYEESPIHR